MRFAAYDLGSNTVKLTVAEIDAPDGAPNVLFETAVPTRIGEDLSKNGYLLDTAMDRTLVALVELVAKAEELQVSQSKCVATAGMRGASNADDFIKRMHTQAGLQVEIISGLREAELAFAAPSSVYGPGEIMVIDVGGRSSEVIVGQGTTIEARVSLELGGVRVTEGYLPSDPPTADELDSARQHVVEALGSAPQVSGSPKIIGVSGTIMSLMGVHLGATTMDDAIARGEGQALTSDAVDATLQDLAGKPAKDRISGSVIPPGRADVIVAGTMIVQQILRHYGQTSLIASNYGVRYGVLAEMARAAQLS